MRLMFGLAVTVVLALPALAQPDVTLKVGAPYIPDGLEMRLTEDCRIMSSGGPPDAHLSCTPGLGWRVHDTSTGEAIYPRIGYLRRDAEWAFAGPEAVAFRIGPDLSIVRLPSGETVGIGPGELEQFRDAEGLGFRAVVWTLPRNEPGQAFILQPDGSLSDPIPGADMRRVDRTRGFGCRPAAVLAALGAEAIPNGTWSTIIRRSAADPDRTLCQTVSDDRLAGLGADGLWRRLDPANFKALSDATYPSADEALEAA